MTNKNSVKFKVGDLVYCPSISPDVLEVLPVDDWQMKKKPPYDCQPLTMISFYS